MQSNVFLAESLRTEQFPLLIAYWTKHREEVDATNAERGYKSKQASLPPAEYAKKKVEDLVTVLNKYETGPVPNAEFLVIKADVNRLIEYGYFGLLDNVSPESMDTIRTAWREKSAGQEFGARIPDMPYAGLDEYKPSNAGLVAGKLKKAEADAKKLVDTDPIYKEFFGNIIPKLKEFLPMATALESLKGRAVKRQAKEKDTPDSLRAKYVAPMASKESGKLVVDALTALSDKLKVTYAEWIFEDSMRRAKEFASKDAQGQFDSQAHFSDLMSIHDAWDESALKRGWDTGEDVVGKDPYSKRERKQKWHMYKLASGHEAAFKKAADRAAQSMQDQFVVKNAQKLDSIVDRKAQQSKLKEAPTPIGKLDVSARGTIAGDLQFTFEDGSSFRVRNKVVWKTRYTNSSYGARGGYTHFVQFPTTFHDVIMPDKTAMGSPSEERMNDVFAKA